MPLYLLKLFVSNIYREITASFHQFPPQTTLQSFGTFLVVWCRGRSEQSTTGEADVLTIHKFLGGTLPSNVEAIDLARVTNLALVFLCAAFNWGRHAVWSGKSGGEREEGEE